MSSQTTRKKKVKLKIKVKWKNVIILLLTLILIIFLFVKFIKVIESSINNAKEKKETTMKKETKTKTKGQTIQQIKLSKLNNINKKIDYFNMNNLTRYVKYKNKNKQLSDEQIVKNVNMNLDRNHYENPISAKYLNTEKMLVNKYYNLDKDYVPNNLENIDTKYALKGMKMVDIAKEAFENMSRDAKKEDLQIIAMSTYRSYEYQVKLYNRYVREDGKEKADTYSGRPGHSEHQTGYAVDVYNKKEDYTNFEQTDEFKWMQEHAHEYGFILRFPKDKENETGYEYESWHYRYVGKETAKYIKDNNISFEEYYATKIKDWK